MPILSADILPFLQMSGVPELGLPRPHYGVRAPAFLQTLKIEFVSPALGWGGSS